uniref:Uncharacterized protein n=1 Tax=Chenopodium quinoa TaxID=63459 RepID=A0A803LGI4_CHEQI
MEGKVADYDALSQQLEDQAQLKSRISDLEQKLQAEEELRKKVENDLELARLELLVVKRRAVNQFLKSDFYCHKLIDRYIGGWVAAHRCVCKADEWDEDRWQVVEDAYGSDRHLSPTSYEESYFADPPSLDSIKNADPRGLPDEQFDDMVFTTPPHDGGLEKEAEKS